MSSRLSKTECFLISRTPDLLKSGLTEELADKLIFLAKKYSKNYGDGGIINTDGVARYIRADGGEGSGNFGHKGRPGEIGGSSPGDGSSASGESESGEKESSGESSTGSESRSSSASSTRSFASGTTSSKLRRVKTNEFIQKLSEAKQTCEKEDAWRVDLPTEEGFNEYHPGASCYTTEGGSTVAVTAEGDIVGVCKNQNDTVSGSALLTMAVETGGIKLDSYDGNHRFYTKNGFEPVSWCKWDGDYAPSDWDSTISNPEDIIFYKYVGKGNVTSEYRDLKTFKSKVAASTDYDTAMQSRDAAL